MESAVDVVIDCMVRSNPTIRPNLIFLQIIKACQILQRDNCDTESRRQILKHRVEVDALALQLA